MKLHTFSLLSVALLLSGCLDFQNKAATIDQSKSCLVQTDEQIKNCKVGELVLFAPQRWGNEQLPLFIIAQYCDTNHQVMYNNSGVVCVFAGERKPGNNGNDSNTPAAHLRCNKSVEGCLM